MQGANPCSHVNYESYEGDRIMEYPKFILYGQEYNHKGESMNPDSWDDCEYTFMSEGELKKFIDSQLEFLFRVRAVYKLDNDILNR